ncbi:PBSX family phage terminase large subunit [Chitinibacter bivalviorum]|uniref:PBSX family phage terminase large subunit n=1 Tax=Chitinibacter bivalviorum TaxID=2739434 RepID=A0A7H9BP52_9NEIS|nr:PBSX family phage terminase large subunit [Chitinibacter bivalviorum]
MNAPFPAKLRGLFSPCRYKVAHGGRGSAKSWSFARALLIQAAQSPLRILCAREVQKSIKDSVHKLLGDQIQSLGLGQFFTITDTSIKGANGTEFAFAGLASHTVESIKSFEGVDIVWVEEAQTVSKKSWDTLTPTIRKPGSEIWVSFNPDLDTDPTYQRFVLNPPPGAWVVQINYNDNPWFPEELEKERVHCQFSDPKSYPNIWEGKCKSVVDGAIYADEVGNLIEQGRHRDVPYDPMLKSHVIVDLGWNDAMSIGVVQKVASELRVIRYIEDSHRTLDSYSAELRNMNLNWGTMYLPHDGAHKDFKTGMSSQQIMQNMGWTVQITPSMSIEDGIRLARMALPRTYIDRQASRLVECLKRYRRGIPQTTNEPGAPLHDEFSHGADMFRYLAINAESFSNDEWGGTLRYPSMGSYA